MPRFFGVSKSKEQVEAMFNRGKPWRRTGSEDWEGFGAPCGWPELDTSSMEEYVALKFLRARSSPCVFPICERISDNAFLMSL